jgi:hypothetical protein
MKTINGVPVFTQMPILDRQGKESFGTILEVDNKNQMLRVKFDNGIEGWISMDIANAVYDN